MSQSIQVNGQTINYPETGDTNWADDATNFAIQTSAAFGKIGLSSGTSVDITQTLDVTGNTTLDANLSVGGNTTLTGNLTVNGNTQLGNENTDTIGVTGIVNVDAGTLYVDPVNNRVGINKTTPVQALDVVGNIAVSGNETVGGTLEITGNVSVNTNKFNITASSGNTNIAGTLGVTGDVAINTNKFNVTASSGNTLIAGTLGVTGIGTFTSDLISGGILTASNSTNITTAPPITFTGDTNTGIGHSAADTLDYVTGGVSRSRLNSTGQQSSVIPDLSGSNTTLYNEYKCRAWVNFNGTTASPSTIRGSGNVSSVTKNGTGNYTINFTTSMPDTNYCCYGFSRQFETGTTLGIVGIAEAATPSVSSINIRTFDAGVGFRDSAFISFGVFR